MSKIRLDQYLCQNGLVQSRERAKALIMSGIVFVNEQKVDKAGEMIAPDAKVEVRGHDIGYVSRGGLKLEKAMQVFPMRPDGKVCMDIGASTGGFTDCMLQNGAVKVYAVDVGYGQLAWSLRTDERVINMERTNIRSVKPEDLSEPVAFFSVDVSFISLKHISRLRMQSARRMLLAYALSSRSLRQAARRSAKRVSCVTPPPIARSCRWPRATPWQTISPLRAWIFRPSRGLRATLNI